jgi:hypothetical protein
MHYGARIPRWFFRQQQPLVAGALVLALLVGSLGIPVLVNPERDLSQPFPCMHHRCGCGSAESCWQGCCCMTLSQKLAWAKEHGITPPDYALAAAEQDDCGVNEGAEPPKTCGSCSKHQQNCQTDETEAAGDGHSLELGLVKIEDYNRCNGLASIWLTIGHALLPKVDVKLPRTEPAPNSWDRVASQTAESFALSPATPPPRHS